MSAETALVEKLKTKDARAFEQIVVRYGPMMYRVALRIVGRQEAEEVMQDALLAICEKIHTFHGRSALGTWIYRIIVNTGLMRLRSRSRLREELMDPLEPRLTENGEFATKVEDWTVLPEDRVLRRELLNHLQRSIERLPEMYRTVYVLAEVEEVPHQEIAAILDVTIGNVKTRLHRARLHLREELANYFAGEKKARR